MKLKRLTLTNFRIFEQATFDFQPGMNLLVGINGVGKSSVLDALRMLLSHALQEFTAFRGRGRSFDIDDITIGRDNLITELHFESDGFSASQLIRKQQEEHIPIKKQEGQVRGQTYDIGENSRFTVHEGHISKDIKTASEQPLAVYFSTRRSLPIMRGPSRRSSAGGQTAAFAEALLRRYLRLREFAEWWLAQEVLSQENADPIATRQLEILTNAVTRFLESYTNLRAVDEPETTLLLDKESITLDVRQLSDGERGLLALVCDLARRLSLANPQLDDPLRDGRGVVLIDELDLHLHPSWQRTVIEKLTTTFPNCQFIATTHSPQIIGECDPTGLILLTKEDGKVVVTQGGQQGFGLDSSWILEHLMGTAPRNVSVQMQINRVEDAIEEGNLQLARGHLADLRRTLHGDDGEVVRLEASINNLEVLADEVDSETP